MTLAEIKSRVMFQTNNDDEDVGDYLPHLLDYINDGYDRLVYAWANQHCGSEDWPWLEEPPTQDDNESESEETTEEEPAPDESESESESDDEPFTGDIPKTPEWTHKYLADWATWLIYRNGNPQKQQRGTAFRYTFEEMLNQIRGSGGMNGLNEDGTQKQFKFFINIPR